MENNGMGGSDSKGGTSSKTGGNSKSLSSYDASLADLMEPEDANPDKESN